MSKPNYMMISVASCDKVYLKDALELIGELADGLKSEAGALVTRYGIVATGEYTNQLIMIQTYTDMMGFEAAFDHYGKSGVYDSMKSSPHVQLSIRSMLKIEDVSLANEVSDKPAIGVMTRWGSDDLKLDKVRGEVGHFEAGGAMVLRYCTILSGQTAGRRLLVVGYPSMAAVEQTYERLRASEGYNQFLTEVDIDWRNIVRVVG